MNIEKLTLAGTDWWVLVQSGLGFVEVDLSSVQTFILLY
jgi:hypothetical protein